MEWNQAVGYDSSFRHLLALWQWTNDTGVEASVYPSANGLLWVLNEMWSDKHDAWHVGDA